MEAAGNGEGRAPSASEQLNFLLRASELLASTLDYEETLRQIAELAVPGIADWCSVDLVDDDGNIESVAVAHIDPAKVQLAAELRERYPPDPQAATGTPAVIRTGEPELFEEISDQLLESAVREDQRELIDIVRELGLSSSMTVPLKVRDTIVGAMTFVSAESGQRYGPADVRFAEELARRAATAIDNARRFSEQARATVRSEERFHLLVENVRDYAIVMLDPEGNIVTWNEGAKRILGYESYEIVGQHFSRFYPENEIASGHPQRELEIAKAEGRYEEEGWRIRKDGSRFIASVVITALYDENGELRGFAKVTRDVTERKAAERELATATAEVERQRLRRVHALEIHDNVIQALVVAKYAQDSGNVEQAARSLEQALSEARRIVGEMQDQTGAPRAGELRRREAFSAPGGESQG